MSDEASKSFDETSFDWASWDDLDTSLAEIDSSIGADGGGDGGDGGGDGGGGD